MRTHALALAVIFAVNAGVFMVAVSCLPDLTAAGIPDASFDAPDLVIVVPAQCGNGVIDLDAGEQCDPGDAAMVGCADCKVTCEGGFIDDTSAHCYWVAPANNQYGNAGGECQAAGGHTVTFVSEDEYARVFDWKTKAGITTFWVGIQEDISGNLYKPDNGVFEPGWSNRCPGCFAHLDAGAGAFPALRDGGRPTCVGASAVKDEPWFAVTCNVPPGLTEFAPSVLCEREPPGATQHDCNGVTCLGVRGGGRYIYVSEAVTAPDAYDFCQKFGMHSVVFETRDEREALARELLTFVPKQIQQVWVGLSRAPSYSQSGSWTWADDASINAYPLEWGNLQPKGGGSWAYMSLSLTAYDVQLLEVDDGTLKLPYICEL